MNFASKSDYWPLVVHICPEHPEYPMVGPIWDPDVVFACPDHAPGTEPPLQEIPVVPKAWLKTEEAK